MEKASTWWYVEYSPRCEISKHKNTRLQRAKNTQFGDMLSIPPVSGGCLCGRQEEEPSGEINSRPQSTISLHPELPSCYTLKNIISLKRVIMVKTCWSASTSLDVLLCFKIWLRSSLQVRRQANILIFSSHQLSYYRAFQHPETTFLAQAKN